MPDCSCAGEDVALAAYADAAPAAREGLFRRQADRAAGLFRDGLAYTAEYKLAVAALFALLNEQGADAPGLAHAGVLFVRTRGCHLWDGLLSVPDEFPAVRDLFAGAPTPSGNSPTSTATDVNSQAVD